MDDVNQEAELKDVLLKFSEYTKYLYAKRKKIIILFFIFLFIGIFLGYKVDSKYNAELTFVVENQQSSVNLGSISGIASQFGFDLGSGSEGTFSEENIQEFLKSQKVIYAVLNQTVKIDGYKGRFLEHYLRINEIDAIFIEDNQNSKSNLNNDSIKSFIWQEILEENLGVQMQDDDANIIVLSYESNNQLFSKQFVEAMIDELSKMYIDYKTAQSRRTLSFLEERADSVFVELKNSEEEYARVVDVNQRIVKASGRLKELQLLRETQVLNTMYLEIVKNLELAKMTLLNQTPIISVLDKPVLPLEDEKIPTPIFSILIAFLGTFFSIFFLIFKKFISDVLKD